ncbi:uncharacterized protein LOC116298944 isoform X4 [Actinia tenebrosa]|uniref:Uncharacterized protein LOC116298944 isoform X4 n=1 Tax=Actinia tenebrosa TaxID=6105 RepID=A0A6P8I806_ACTTE|nr:uncharacterized protein LOC116298944 isoform X4 [Actinia tenebrosa]
MKLTVFLIMAMSIAHTSLAEPEPNLNDLGMFEEERYFQANQLNLEETPTFVNENLQTAPALSLNDVFQKNGEEWSEKSFLRAIKSLGVLKMEGLKLVRLPKSMIKTMKRMPNQTIVRPITYFHPDSKVQYDATPSQCKENVYDMFTLAHADSRLAYKVEAINCKGKCSENKSCVLKKKAMLVYLLDPNGRLLSRTFDVGCTCVCM